MHKKTPINTSALLFRYVFEGECFANSQVLFKTLITKREYEKKQPHLRCGLFGHSLRYYVTVAQNSTHNLNRSFTRVTIILAQNNNGSVLTKSS